jgi:hypothetical protein
MASSSASSSVTPAASAAAGNSVNVPAGYPAAERYPGPVDPVQYTDAGPEFPIEGPPSGDWVLGDAAAGSLPEQSPGGGIQDTSWTSGTDGPQLPWDSAAGAPFAPSAAVNPDLHGQDTGAVFTNQYSTPPAIGRIERQTIPGQTWNREYVFDPVQGMYVPQANGRANMDQRQVWDPAPGDGGGWAPWDPGYSERPVLLNVAYQASPVTEEGGIYGVSGALPDRAPFNAYAAQAYAAPPDPIVTQPAAPAAGTGGGWLLG